MRILFVGDVVGRPGRRLLARALPGLKSEHRPDLIVVNGPGAMHAVDTQVEVLDGEGNVLGSLSGSKQQVGKEVFRIIQERLIRD